MAKVQPAFNVRFRVVDNNSANPNAPERNMIMDFTCESAMKMADFLMMKTTTNQSYNIENGDMFKQPREIVRTSYVEPNATWGGRSDIGVSLTSALWGASSITRITIEYDRNNEFLLNATIWYNRHRADQNLALTETELREKLEEDFNTHGIFDENLKEEYAKEALAVEKREALNEKIEEGEDEDEEEED